MLNLSPPVLPLDVHTSDYKCRNSYVSRGALTTGESSGNRDLGPNIKDSELDKLIDLVIVCVGIIGPGSSGRFHSRRRLLLLPITSYSYARIPCAEQDMSHRGSGRRFGRLNLRALLAPFTEIIIGTNQCDRHIVRPRKRWPHSGIATLACI